MTVRIRYGAGDLRVYGKGLVPEHQPAINDLCEQIRVLRPYRA